MKRKIVSPDIQQKKLQQAIEKEQDKDLKHELDEDTSGIPKKIQKNSPKPVINKPICYTPGST